MKIYVTVIRPLMMQGAEPWTPRKKLLQRVELRISKWITGILLRDWLPSEEIRRRAEVVKISEKIIEAKFRWYSHE